MRRLWQRLIDSAVERRLQQERAVEWQRIAPGGVPIWVLPDQDLERIISQMAASKHARSVEITYYMEEYNRREQRRLNESMARANRQMVRLTWAVVVLTLAAVALALASLLH